MFACEKRDVSIKDSFVCVCLGECCGKAQLKDTFSISHLKKTLQATTDGMVMICIASAMLQNTINTVLQRTKTIQCEGVWSTSSF